MQLIINSIEQVSPTSFRVWMQLDDRTVVASIIESNDTGVSAFNFEHEFFDALCAFDGIGARFNRDYWRWRRGEHDPFPWNYGNYEDDILRRALTIGGTDLSTFSPDVDRPSE